MLNAVQPDTSIEGTAVNMINVTKSFSQWQRSGRITDIFRNLIKPEIKTVFALDNVSLTIRQGEFVAYAGANGAGKSTTIKLMSGILQPSSGTLHILGLSPQRSRIELMKQIGIIFGQRTELWWDHPVSVSFDWKQVVWNIPKADYMKMRKMVVELLDLGDIMNTFARELSLGQRMRADLGLMLLHSPELILLDEPTLGLDVLAKRHMIDFLKHLNRENGTTIVVTSHDMDDLEEMAERIILLSKGRIAFDGSFDELRELTGSLRRISIAIDGLSEKPVIPWANLISVNGNICEYEFDAGKRPIRQMLAEVAGIQGVIDLETHKAPIEQVIAELYTKWQGQK